MWRRTTWDSYRSDEPAWEVLVDVDALGLAQVLLNCGLVALLFVALAAAAHGVDRVLTRRAQARREPSGVPS